VKRVVLSVTVFCLVALLAGCNLFVSDEKEVLKRLSLIQSTSDTLLEYMANEIEYSLLDNGTVTYTANLTQLELANHKNLFAFDCTPPTTKETISYIYAHQVFNTYKGRGTFDSWWTKGGNPLLYKVRIENL
jgi:hypothetical protein